MGVGLILETKEKLDGGFVNGAGITWGQRDTNFVSSGKHAGNSLILILGLSVIPQNTVALGQIPEEVD